MTFVQPSASSPTPASNHPLHADVVIIGAGQAGVQVAVSLRQKRFAGSIVLINAEEHPPYHRPPLSKAALKEGFDPHTLQFRPEGFFEKQGITELRGTTVETLDPDDGCVQLAGGQALSYSTLVLATGARVRRLPESFGLPPACTHVLRSQDDARALQSAIAPGKRVAIIGAGFIGLEVAASARQMGAEVSVIDREARILQRSVSPTIASHLHARHLENGVTFFLAETLIGAAPGTQGWTLTCRSGATIPFDLVVEGIGVQPETALAEAAGIACRDGILADAQGRTSNAAIFAIGDCARHAHVGFDDPVRFESVQSAIDEAKVVAGVICGEDVTHTAVPWFWSDQYDQKLQMVGLVPAEGNRFIKGDPASGSFAVYHMDGEHLAAVEAVNAPHDFVFARKHVGTRAALDGSLPLDLTPIAA